MAIEIGQDFLEKYGLSGLSSIITAAIVRAEKSDPRAKKILFRATIREVCQTALKSGIGPTELCEAATTILELSHTEIIKLRKEEAEKRRVNQIKEEKELEAELNNKGL